jgi:ABC-2 type transport system ATP-binding protein
MMSVSPETLPRPMRTISRVEVSDAGVRYRVFTEHETTIKGRVLNSIRGRNRQKFEFWALRNVNLQIAAGEVIGIIGANGCGKTTLLRLMAGIFEPTEGQVSVTGHVSPLLDLAGGLNPDLTARQNARLYAALHRLDRATISDLIPAVEEFSELGSFFDVPVKAYSSGMLARLGFALATQVKPEILLIDEVLAVGDESFQKKSYFRMMKLIERGSIVVLVSHNMDMVEQVCTRVVHLARGRLVEDGRPAQVIRSYLKRC